MLEGIYSPRLLVEFLVVHVLTLAFSRSGQLEGRSGDHTQSKPGQIIQTSTDVGGCSVGFSGGSGAEMLSPEEEPLLLEDVPETRPNAVAVYGTRWW